MYSNLHVDLCKSRKNCNTGDSKEVFTMLKNHSQFECPSDTFISISTGIKAHKTINCECAKLTDQVSLNKFIGGTYDSKFLCKNKVQILSL